VKAAVARCARHRLLPEQESTIDATLRLLGEARLAIADGDMARAASLAREARQLSTSLGCP
jgi:hypothetical protein